ncbi:MAG: AAA family ATPase, partial [bacterium]|nr:AAA family ATPase [bacterium]
MNDPRGSIWRKWDLHVHTKNTAKNDQFTSSNFDDFCKTFFRKAIDKNIYAIGITDYFNVENYIKVKQYVDKIGNNDNFSDNDKKNIKAIFLLPNIELRILPVTDASKLINIHILVNPKVVDELENWLFNSIEFVSSSGTPHKMNKRGFIELGYESGVSENDQDAYRAGINNFTVSQSDLQKLYDTNLKLKENTIIAISNSSNDGASGLQEHYKLFENDAYSSLDATRSALYKLSQMILSGNPEDRKYFLGAKTDSEENVIKKCGKLMPCIHGSDAHEEDKLFSPYNNRYCWIKADTTFEGLKQILYEPDERVYIGEEPPIKIERSKIIESMVISSSNNWFDDEPIYLNENMVSIIGGKGAGKTAIADLIAYTSESYKCYEENNKKSKSFLKKALKVLKGTKIKLQWCDNSSQEKEIEDRLLEFDQEGKIRYLPQDYVDQLCSEIGKDELEKQIEDVIYQQIPLEQRSIYTNFKSYKEAQLSVLNDNKKRVTDKIRDINIEIFKSESLINLKYAKNEGAKKTELEIKRFQEKLDDISKSIINSEEQGKIVAKYTTLNEEKRKMEKIISQMEMNLLKIDRLKNKKKTFLEDAYTLIEEIKNQLKEIGVKNDTVEKIVVTLSPDNFDQILDDKKSSIEDDVKAYREKLNENAKMIKEEEGRITLDKSKQENVKEINIALTELKKKRDSLSEDMSKIISTERRLIASQEKRMELILQYFEFLYEESKILKKIYSPIEELLKSSSIENENLFEFTIKFNYDMRVMADEGYRLIDLRADGEFRQSKPDVFREKISKERIDLDLDKDKISDENKRSIKIFFDHVNGLFTTGGKKIESQLKEKQYTEQDFYDWIYNTKYYSINYSIKFSGVEIDVLSPGMKGVALLILFLELDKEDKRPILIDQPEENLDNRSVYRTLKGYFRNAKKRRQVIIVTHNPNLVVNTDSEQIIVANYDGNRKKQNTK